MSIVALKNNRGFTLVEILVTLSILLLVIFGMLSLLNNSSRANNKTQTQTDTDTSIALSLEKISGCLIEAREITIDTDGLGITYKYPSKQTNSNYYEVDSKSVETTSHKLYVSNGKLYSSDSTTKPILKNIPTIDPETNQTLKVFSTGINSKEVVIRLVSQKTTNGNQKIYSAVTSRIRPRNM